MEYAYLVGQDHQWRYDVAADTWSVLPSVRPVPSGGAFSAGAHQWGIVGAFVYAVLEDGGLYRAQWTATDLVWSGPLATGFPTLSYQIVSVNDTVWVLTGSDATIRVYDPDAGAITEILAVPTALSNCQYAGLAYDGQNTVYAAFGNTTTGTQDFWAYDLTLGTWSQPGLPGGVGLTGTLYPMSTRWWAGKLYVMNYTGTLLYFTPAGAVWQAIPESNTLYPNGAWLTPFGDGELGLLYVRGAFNTMKQVSPTNIFSATTAPPSVPVGEDPGFFSVYTLVPVPPFPATIWPVEVTLPKEFQTVEVPGVRGAVAVESTHGTPTVRFEGKLQADDGEGLRTLIDAALTAFLSALTLEILPGRVCTGYVTDHTLDPKWVGVNDTLLDFSFTMKIPSATFYDYSGNGSFVP